MNGSSSLSEEVRVNGDEEKEKRWEDELVLEVRIITKESTKARTRKLVFPDYMNS